jgi:hypothetical protein
LKRRRVKVAKVKAPAAGTVSWTATAEAHVKKGQEIGFVTAKAGGRQSSLKAAKDGVLVMKATEGAAVKRGALIADIVYAKAIIQAMAADAQPTNTWGCEVSDPSSGQRADCSIFKVVPKGKGALVTGTTEPLWFDAAAAPVMRLTPP